MPEVDTLHLLAQDVAVLKRDYAGLHQDVSGLGSKIDALTAQVSAQQRTNWPLILSIGTVLLAVIGGGWRVVDLSNQLSVSQEVAPLRAAMLASDTAQGELSSRVDRLAASMADNRGRLEAAEARATALETEQETQFRAIDNTINGNQAENFRMFGMLWPKSFGSPLPTFWHAPEIGRER